MTTPAIAPAPAENKLDSRKSATGAPVPAGARAGRTALVALVWSLAILPVAFGMKQCTVARVFHTPCPGCGLTRAGHLFLEGHVVASLQMHPLFVPIIASHLVLALATLYATWTTGTPFYFYETKLGRAALWFIGTVYAIAILLWVARFFGALGGPVPV